MRKYLTKLITGAFIVASPLFFAPEQASGLEKIASPVVTTQVDSVGAKSDSTTKKQPPKKKKIKTNVKGGGMYNDASYGGYFNSSVSVVEQRLKFGLTYDQVKINDEMLNKKTDKKKERRVLVGFAEYNVWKNMVLGLTYDSDGVMGLYSTLAKIGVNRQFFSKKLSIEGNMALKVGEINKATEKEDVVGVMLKLSPIEFFKKIGIEFKGEGHLPRRYVRNGIFDGPWTGTLYSALTYKISDTTRIGMDFNLRRDHLTPDWGITRKGVNFMVSISGDDGKGKKGN